MHFRIELDTIRFSRRLVSRFDLSFHVSLSTSSFADMIQTCYRIGGRCSCEAGPVCHWYCFVGLWILMSAHLIKVMSVSYGKATFWYTFRSHWSVWLHDSPCFPYQRCPEYSVSSHYSIQSCLPNRLCIYQLLFQFLWFVICI